MGGEPFLADGAYEPQTHILKKKSISGNGAQKSLSVLPTNTIAPFSPDCYQMELEGTKREFKHLNDVY